VKDKRRVLAIVVPKKEGGQQTALNHYNIHKTLQILTKNKSGSITKYVDGLLTTTLLSQKLILFRQLTHRRLPREDITTSTKIHSRAKI